MDILVMPLSKAKALVPIWNSAHNSTNWCFFDGFIVFVIALCYLAHCINLWDKERHHLKLIIKIGATITIAILGFSIFISHMNDDNSPYDNNIGAINNVGVYYKMRHLRKIYPKLPCQSQIDKRACQTNSINKATAYHNKHTFTKSQASKEYNELRKVYRRDGGPNTNNTKSLHPVKPKWWNYIWA